MSWTDEELDNLVRNASKQVPDPVYQDEYFDEIVHLLPKKKKNRWWFVVFLPVLSLPFFFLTSSTSSIKGVSYTKAYLPSNELVNNSSDKPSLVEIKVKQSNQIKDFEHEIFDAFVETKKEEDKTSESTEAINKNAGLDALKVGFQTKLAIKKPSYLESNPNANLARLLLKNKFKHHFLTVNSQFGVASSLIQDANSKMNLVFDAGLAYHRQLSLFNVELGVNLSAFVPQQLSFEKKSIVYGIKTNRYQQKINYHSIFGVDLPIQISKNFQRNTISFSFVPQYFLGATVKLNQTKNDEPVSNNQYFITKHGVRDWGLKLAFGYQFKLSNEFEMGMKISTQLINPLEKTVLETSTAKFPVMGQLCLKKYIKLK